jgi:uncharacterized membrane protein (DUF4010 family)
VRAAALLRSQPAPRCGITPRQIWLAVLAVCTVSYASYLLQRYVAPRDGGLWAAVLGGLYSSTATTVVLARRVRAAPALLREAQTGIILATSIMYLRMLIIVALFNQALAIALAPTLLGLAAFGLFLAGLWYRLSGAPTGVASPSNTPPNPLELTAALIFAALFVAVSLASTWVRSRFGEAGLYGLAAIVGTTDIDQPPDMVVGVIEERRIDPEMAGSSAAEHLISYMAWSAAASSASNRPTIERQSGRTHQKFDAHVMSFTRVRRARR